jgi:hypothetical protein
VFVCFGRPVTLEKYPTTAAIAALKIKMAKLPKGASGLLQMALKSSNSQADFGSAPSEI